MAAAPDTTATDSLDLAEAVALITDLPPSDPAATDRASQDEPSPTPEGASGTPASEVAPSDPASKEGVSAVAAEGSESGSAEDAAPAFWDDTDKAAWTKVPADLRPVLARYERQRLDFVAEKTRAAAEERDEALRVAQAANATVEQAADWWRRNGQAFHQAFVDRWSRVDWKGLAEKDPAEVGRLIQQRQEEEALLAEATRRGEADIAAAEAEAEAALAEARRVESGKLAAKLPEWFGTPQVAERTWDELRRYLFAKGVPADRVGAVYEAPVVEIALNAMRFEHARALAEAARRRAGQGAAPPRPSSTPASPARVSPGPAIPPVDRAPDAVRQAAERFHRGGGASIADAAELIRLSGL